MKSPTKKALCHQLAYVTNLGLALRRAVLERDAARITEYSEKLLACADGPPAPPPLPKGHPPPPACYQPTPDALAALGYFPYRTYANRQGYAHATQRGGSAGYMVCLWNDGRVSLRSLRQSSAVFFGFVASPAAWHQLLAAHGMPTRP